MSNKLDFKLDASAYSFNVEGNELVVSVDPVQYEVHRPTELTTELENKMDSYRQAFIAAVVEGATAKVAKTMKKNADVLSAKISCPVSPNFGIDAVVTRSREMIAPSTKEPVTYYGSVHVEVTTAYKKKGVIKQACAGMTAAIKNELAPKTEA